jgi:hypothetical protein
MGHIPNLDSWSSEPFFGRNYLNTEKKMSSTLICTSASGLPDGIFSYQKSQIGEKIEVLRMENV